MSNTTTPTERLIKKLSAAPTGLSTMALTAHRVRHNTIRAAHRAGLICQLTSALTCCTQWHLTRAGQKMATAMGLEVVAAYSGYRVLVGSEPRQIEEVRP